jgi:hypothetical protein
MDKIKWFTIPISSFSLDTEFKEASNLLTIDSDAIDFLVCDAKR